jgi:hypothetical protein
VSGGPVELVLSNPSSALANEVTYDAQVFAIGAEARIPEIEIRYKATDGSEGSVKSAPAAFNVVSTLDPSEPNPAPRTFAPLPVLVLRFDRERHGRPSFSIALCAVDPPDPFPKKPGAHSHPRDFARKKPPSPPGSLAAARRARAEGLYIQLIQILKQYLRDA